MVFYSIDPEARSVSEVEEPRTIRQLSRMIALAIDYWLYTGADNPDGDFTDGISEQESALQWS